MRGLRIIVISFVAVMISGCATYSGNAMTNSSDPWQAVNRPVFVVNDISTRCYSSLLQKVMMR